MDMYTVACTYKGNTQVEGGLTKDEAGARMLSFLGAHKPSMWVTCTVTNTNSGVGAEFRRSLDGTSVTKRML